MNARALFRAFSVSTTATFESSCKGFSYPPLSQAAKHLRKAS